MPERRDPRRPLASSFIEPSARAPQTVRGEEDENGRPKPRRAAALTYSGGMAPTVVAAGSGEVAERIEAKAIEAGVPVERDGPLAEALARLPVDSEIPPELYRAVAEVLIWARGVEIAARAEQYRQ